MRSECVDRERWRQKRNGFKMSAEKLKEDLAMILSCEEFDGVLEKIRTTVSTMERLEKALKRLEM